MAAPATAFAAAFLLVGLGPRAASACTAIAVGSEASSTGYAMVTHTDDSGPTTTDVRLVRVPRQIWPPGSKRPIYHWKPGYPRVVSRVLGPDYAPVGDQQETEFLAQIPQVEMTYAYWDTDYGVQNEKGVSMGESTCTGKTIGWPATRHRKAYGYNRIGMEDLSKIGMERCATARCAAQTMGDLAVELGFYSTDSGEPEAPMYQASTECMFIADPTEVWVWHVMTGRNNASAIWAAQRLPNSHVAVLANAFIIHKMNLSDSENFMYSPGVTDLAVEQGWWHPREERSPEIFDFMKAYGFLPPPGYNPPDETTILQFYSGRRMWRVFDLLTPEGKKLDPNKGHLPDLKDPYPTSMPAPKGSITPQMMREVQRDHYEGTPYDLTKGMAAGPYGNPNRWSAPLGFVGQWERAISMHRSTWSFIAEVKPRRQRLWWGHDSPHGTAYVPFYGTADKGAPEAWHTHEGYMSKLSYKAVWWAFNLINQFSELNFQAINKVVREKAKEVEDEADLEVERWEREVEHLHDEVAVLEVLSERSNAFANKVARRWWRLWEEVLERFSRHTVTVSEDADNGSNPFEVAYPPWFLESEDVGFTSWAAAGPTHGVPDDSITWSATRTAEVVPVTPTWLPLVLVVVATNVAAAAVAHAVGVRRGIQRVVGSDCYVAQV